MDAYRTTTLVCRWLATIPTVTTRNAYAQALGVGRVAAAAGLCDELAAYCRAVLNRPVPGGCSPGDPSRQRCPDSAWLPWCATNGMDPLSADVVDADAATRWVADMRECGLSRGYVRQRLSAVRGFYRYAAARGWVDRDPTGWVSPARVCRPGVERVPLALSGTDLARVQLAADDAHTWMRDDLRAARVAALVALLTVTGARIGEVLAANIDDWSPAREPGGAAWLVVRRKGGQVQRLPARDAADRVRRYLAHRASTGDRLRGDSPLLATRTSVWNPPGRWTGERARDSIRAACAHSTDPDTRRLSDRVHPHALRAGAITALLDAGVPLEAVQAMVGHTSPVTTARYDRAAEVRAFEASRRLGSMVAGDVARLRGHDQHEPAGPELPERLADWR